MIYIKSLVFVSAITALLSVIGNGAQENQNVAKNGPPPGAIHEPAPAAEFIARELASDPKRTVDRLNESWMTAMLKAGRFTDVEKIALDGTISVAADTWRIEQLQKHRVRALLEEGKAAEALAGAKALFNVSGMHFTPEALSLLAECLHAAHPENPGIVARFKLQEIEGAQTDADERAKGLAATGEAVLAKVPIDPTPYISAVHRLYGAADYRSLYGLGNLLLLSGDVKGAREAFERAYRMAPATELKSASEAIAKLIKAEDGTIGRANAFVLSIRPKS